MTMPASRCPREYATSHDSLVLAEHAIASEEATMVYTRKHCRSHIGSPVDDNQINPLADF